MASGPGKSGGIAPTIARPRAGFPNPVTVPFLVARLLIRGAGVDPAEGSDASLPQENESTKAESNPAQSAGREREVLDSNLHFEKGKAIERPFVAVPQN